MPACKRSTEDSRLIVQKFVIGCLSLLSLSAWAESPPRIDRGLEQQLCRVVVIKGDPVHPTGDITDRRVYIEADIGELDRDRDLSRFFGNVQLHHKDIYLEADRVDYLAPDKTLDANGNLYLSKPGFRAIGEQLQMDTESGQSVLNQAEYRMLRKSARGHADQMRIISSDYSEYDRISYTTCEPGDDSWLLRAKTLQVDEQTGVGTAYHATFHVQDLPVFYTPYISFPIDERRMSGFLSPTYGGSDRTGIDLRLPYYFNLAPDYDLIVTPRFMQKRGVMLGSEFRYLTRNNHRGSIIGDYISDDRGRKSDEPVERYAVSYRNQWRISPRWRNSLLFDGVSDKTYLDDFGDALFEQSTRYLERRADLNYLGERGRLLMRVQAYQTIDRSIASSATPYTRLPQLLWTTDRRDPTLGLHYQLEAEFTHFEHDERVHGQRLALNPAISLPLRRSYGHLIPKLSLNYNDYRLEGQTADQDHAPSLLLPTASLDSGLIFERDISWFGNAASQTLEPRLFYLYTPYEEQDESPSFDSAELGFSFANLFKANRFSGYDRVGDANQLTLALTSRILHAESGRELFRGSMGQAFYFQDRKVQLSGGDDVEHSSSIALELSASLGTGWSSRLNLQWDPHAGQGEVETGRARLYYRGGHNKLLNLSYNYNRDSVSSGLGAEDIEFSFHWPFNQHFALLGGWDYSLYHEETFEQYAGLEYGGGCCWVLRTLYRENLQEVTSERSSSFMIQVELRGLGAVGNPMQSFLEDNISGYIVPETK